MINHQGPVIADIRVAKEENCFPMIPSGAAHNEMILGVKIKKMTHLKLDWLLYR